MDKITIRPSSLNTFQQCSHQWYRVFILGETSIPSARAAIGTAVHRGIEVMWTESMEKKEKIASLSYMTDAAMDAFKEEEQKGLQYDEKDDKNSCAVEIVKGVETYASDIMPFAKIPDAVEKRFTVTLDHPLVEAVSGTVDYISDKVIVDVKTSKRKPIVANYETQQGLYRFLANSNGMEVSQNLIHGVIFTKETQGVILPMPVDVTKAVNAVNVILDTTEILVKDIVDPEILFRGNPQYYLCSPKYCAFYNDCKFVKGEAKESPVKKPVKL